MIPSIVDQQGRDALAPALQAEYKPLEGHDGYFIADVGEVDHEGGRYALENVSGLRQTLEDIRHQRNTLRDSAKRFEGIDLDDYRKLMERRKEIEEWSPDNDDAAKARIEEVNSNWQSKYEADVAGERSAREAIEAKYNHRTCEVEALAALAKHAPKASRLLLREVMDRIAVFPTDDPNRDAVFVVGEGGKPKITNVAGQTGNMTVDELVGTVMKKDPELAQFYPGTGATGSGAAGSSTAGPNQRGNGPDVSKLSGAERLKHARRRNSGGMASAG